MSLVLCIVCKLALKITKMNSNKGLSNNVYWNKWLVLKYMNFFKESTHLEPCFNMFVKNTYLKITQFSRRPKARH